jgi:hypothetical protein
MHGNRLGLPRATLWTAGSMGYPITNSHKESVTNLPPIIRVIDLPRQCIAAIIKLS